MSISISEGQARLIYLDYHTRGNTMGTSPQEMGAIVSQYADKIATWQTSVDSNQYEWDDSDYDEYIEDGKEIGMEATGGHTRADQAGDVAASTGHLVGAAAGTATTIALGGVKEASKNVGAIAGKLTGKAAGKAGAEATKNALPFSAYIGAIVAIATYAAYLIKKPNKDGNEACKAVANPLTNAQGALQGSQSEMEKMQAELVNLSNEASAQNDNTNSQIVDKKTEQDYYLKIYNSLKAKISSGKELTADEKSLYKFVAAEINNTGANIDSLVEENSVIITDINESMGTYQEGYDYAAETMGEAQGVAEYSASFDTQTKSFAYVEAVAQGINAVGGLVAGLRLLVGPIWQWVVGFASIAAGVGSGVAVKEQLDIAKNADNTLQTRKVTEDLNVATQEVYDVEVDNYAVLMEGTETLELAVPQELATVDSSVPNNKKPKKTRKRINLKYF